MTLLQIHVAISLVGILVGFIVIFGFFGGQRLNGATAIALTFTILTSVTGFFLPLHGLSPAVIVGIVSLVVLAVAVYARYGKNLAGSWLSIYVITAVIAFYFNFFVLIAQSFQKVSALKSFNGGPVFLAAQVIALLLFIVFAIVGVRRLRA